MNKIKAFIIHKLGGCTEQEYLKLGRTQFCEGRLASMYLAKQHAENLMGLSGDAWSQDMYQYIVDDIRSLESKD